MKHHFIVLALLNGILLLFPSLLIAQNTQLSNPLRLDDDSNAQSGAQMIFSNPAGLGFNEKYQLSYDFWGTTQGKNQHAISLSYNPFKTYHIALGWQQGSFVFANAIRFQQLSLGLSYHSASDFWHENKQNLSQTLKIGFQYRIARYLSLGVSEWLYRAPFEEMKLFTEIGFAVKPLLDRSYLSTSLRTESNHNASLLSSFHFRLSGGNFFLGSISLYARHQYQLKTEEQSIALGLSFNDDFSVLGGLQAPMDKLDSTNDQMYYGGLRIKAKPAEEERDSSKAKIVEISLSQLAEIQKKSVLLINDEFRSPYLDKLLTFKKLAQDPNVSAVVLTIAGENYEWGRAWEIGKQIEALKTAGKKVYAYVLSANTQSYFVASHAHEIWTPPVFELMLTSLGGQWVYFGDFLKNIGVQPQFLAVGDYKNAPEVFVKNGPSPYAKEVSQNLIDQKYQLVLETITKNRSLTTDQTKEIIAQGPFVSSVAKNKKLIDGIAFYDEFLRVLEKKHKNHRLDQRYEQGIYQTERWGHKDQIAVIHAVGELGGGTNLLSGQDKIFNPEIMIPLIERLKYNSKVKAVVLRIDSPGGDVNGADHIWRYLSLLAKQKPLIVSMGDVAASGGYYVAAPAKKIFASPLTITGSIGIFAGKFSISQLLKKFGIEVYSMEKDPNAHTMSMLTPWPESLEKQFTASLTELYEIFLSRVLSGRKALNREQLIKIAGGRVWTGNEAIKNGLVDQIGGLADAIEEAVKLAKIDDYEVKAYFGESQSSIKRAILGQVAVDSLLESSADDVVLPQDGFGTEVTQGMQHTVRQLYQQLLLSLSNQSAEQLIFIFSSLLSQSPSKVMALLPWMELNHTNLYHGVDE